MYSDLEGLASTLATDFFIACLSVGLYLTHVATTLKLEFVSLTSLYIYNI